MSFTPPPADGPDGLPPPWLPCWLDGLFFMLLAMAFAGSMAALAFCSVGAFAR